MDNKSELNTPDAADGYLVLDKKDKKERLQLGDEVSGSQGWSEISENVIGMKVSNYADYEQVQFRRPIPPSPAASENI